jgi:hypothetical protein
LSPSPLSTSSPATSLPTPSPVLLPSPLHLSACDEEDDGKGGKRDGDGDKEGNDEGGKGDGDGN